MNSPSPEDLRKGSGRFWGSCFFRDPFRGYCTGSLKGYYKGSVKRFLKRFTYGFYGVKGLGLFEGFFRRLL